MNLGLRTILLLAAVALFVLAVFSDRTTATSWPLGLAAFAGASSPTALGWADRTFGSSGSPRGTARHLAQCRKCRRPVKTIAAPAPSTASITSGSRFEPPGWISAVTPASSAISRAVREREESVRSE